MPTIKRTQSTQCTSAAMGHVVHCFATSLHHELNHIKIHLKCFAGIQRKTNYVIVMHSETSILHPGVFYIVADANEKNGSKQNREVKNIFRASKFLETLEGNMVIDERSTIRI